MNAERRASEPEFNGMRIEWATIILVILTWLFSFAVTYGVMTTKLNYLEQRVDTIEKRQLDVIAHYLTREEYQRVHEQLGVQVEHNRVELGQKIDDVRSLVIAHARESEKRNK